MLTMTHDETENWPGGVPPLELRISPAAAVKEFGIGYPTLRMYWTTGAKGYRLRSWKRGGQYIILLRSEVEELARRLNEIEPNIP